MIVELAVFLALMAGIIFLWDLVELFKFSSVIMDREEEE